MRPRTIVAVLLLGLIASIAAAQRGRPRGGYFRPVDFATLADFDGTFQFCRIVFRQAANGDGGGWDVDFPRADENLSIRLSELTKRLSAWTRTMPPSTCSSTCGIRSPYRTVGFR
jgi:hypothetical protein